jgi:hypothetical protein
MNDSIDLAPREPRSVLGTLDELLRQPRAGLARARAGAPVRQWALRVFAGTLCCWALYGAGSGFFAGGWQIGLAAVKAPLILAGSAVLCVPSLYVFGLLAGAPLTRARFAVTLTGFVGMLALVMAGLLPIEWLFSVSTESLAFVVWLHLALWTIAIIFGARFLRAAMPEVATGALVLWVVLFCVVCFQVTTFMRPTLWREPDAAILAHGKLFFLDHFKQALR